MFKNIKQCSFNLLLQIWLLTLITLVFGSNYKESICEIKYQNIHPEHSMCKPRNATCKFIREAELDSKQLLDLHNQIRKSVKEVVGKGYHEGRNMENMQWDHELYLIAQQHVLQCVEQPDCPQCHQIDRFHVEQNFAGKTFNSFNYNSNESTERFKTVIREWAEELRKYNPDIVSRFRFIGLPTNWTNIFRATTVKVGCASVTYSSQMEGSFKEVYVCNYGPAILVENEEIYKQAYKCSKCPNGSTCDVYSDLCRNQLLHTYESDTSLSNKPLERERGNGEKWLDRIKRDGDECPSKYLNITKNHSMCKPVVPGCKFTRKYRKFKSRLEDIHNIIRNSINDYAGSHHSTATNMRVMAWDEELYEIARRYVIQCNESPDCSLCHQIGDFPVEQNFEVKILTFSNNKISEKRFIKVIKEWASELQQYTQEDVQSLPNNIESKKKNWINIFRATTWKLGCASIAFEASQIPNKVVKETYICNYGPAKLSAGEEVYEFGPSCSNCGDGFSCDKRYPNLCSPNPEPTTVPPASTLLTKVHFESALETDTNTNASTTNDNTSTTNDNTSTTSDNTEYALQKTSKSLTSELRLQPMTNEPETIYSSKNKAPNNDIIWNCTFRFFSDKMCQRQQECYKTWRISSDENQPYIEIDIPENTKTGLLFLHNIYIEKPSCFTFNYMKNTLNSWSFLTSRIFAIVIRLDSNENIMAEFNDDVSNWHPATLNIPWMKVFIQAGIAVKSNFGAGEQHIQIKDLVIHSGPCSAP